MKLLILGASGRSGRALVEEALKRGHAVTVLVREGTPFEAKAGVRIVRGDVFDAQTLKRAVEGQEAVAAALGLRRTSEFPYARITSPLDLMSRSMARLIEAMHGANVARICAISAAGVGDSAANMNWMMRFLIRTSSIGPAYQDMARMEALLETSGLDWTALRPTTLTNGKAKGRVRMTPRYSLLALISRADVAATVLDVLERPKRRTFPTRTPMLRG